MTLLVAATPGCGVSSASYSRSVTVTKDGKVVYSSSNGSAGANGFSGGEAKYTATDSKSASAGTNPVVTITNDYGDISVTTGSAGSLVQASAIKHAGRQADLAKLTLVVSSQGNTVDVRLQRPAPNVQNLWADLKVVVPVGAQVQESTVSGSIRADGVGGGVTCKTGYGDVTLTGIGGQVDANTTSGSITVQDSHGCRLTSGYGDIRLERCTGDATVDTTSGSITASDLGGDFNGKSGYGDVRAENCSGTVQANSTSGAIHVSESKGPFDLSSGYGGIEVSGSPGPLTGASTVTATSGSISFDVPSSAKLNVSASSTSGEVTNDFDIPVTKNGMQSSMTGQTNASAPGSAGSLNMTTSYGDIRLDKA